MQVCFKISENSHVEFQDRQAD